MNPVKKTVLYFVLILSISVSCDNYDISSKQSDTFIKFYGGNSLDYGSDVKQLPNGSFFVTGTFSVNENNADIFTLITDEYGNSKTDLKIFGGSFNDKIAMTQLLSGGGAVAIGTYQQRAGNNDIWILRFDANGDTIWTRKFGSANNDEGLGLVITEANEIVCIGYTTVIVGTNIADKQIWMHKLSLDGNELWANQRIHGSIDEPAFRFAIDEIGNYIINRNDGYVILFTTSSGTNNKYISIQKLDINGVHLILGPQTIKLENDIEGKVIKPLSDGFLVLATSTSITDGSSDILLTKLDSNLVTIYTRVIDTGESETASALVYNDNRIYILGTSYNTRNDTRRMLFISMDKNGENPVFHPYGFTKEKIEGFGMDETSDGGFILTGSNILLYKMLNPDDF